MLDIGFGSMEFFCLVEAIEEIFGEIELPVDAMYGDLAVPAALGKEIHRQLIVLGAKKVCLPFNRKQCLFGGAPWAKRVDGGLISCGGIKGRGLGGFGLGFGGLCLRATAHPPAPDHPIPVPRGPATQLTKRPALVHPRHRRHLRRPHRWA